MVHFVNEIKGWRRVSNPPLRDAGPLKVPDLQCIMPAADVRLSRGKRLQHAAAMLHCVRDTLRRSCAAILRYP